MTCTSLPWLVRGFVRWRSPTEVRLPIKSLSAPSDLIISPVRLKAVLAHCPWSQSQVSPSPGSGVLGGRSSSFSIAQCVPNKSALLDLFGVTEVDNSCARAARCRGLQQKCRFTSWPFSVPEPFLCPVLMAICTQRHPRVHDERLQQIHLRRARVRSALHALCVCRGLRWCRWVPGGPTAVHLPLCKQLAGPTGCEHLHLCLHWPSAALLQRKANNLPLWDTAQTPSDLAALQAAYSSVFVVSRAGAAFVAHSVPTVVSLAAPCRAPPTLSPTQPSRGSNFSTSG